MKFRGLFNYAETVPNSPGLPIAKTLGQRIDDKGRTEVYYNGERNVYEEIQASVGMSDPYTILAAMERSGDSTLLDTLSKVKGQYIDVTSSPSSFRDVAQLQLDSKNAFYRLPAELRELFGNSYEVFASDTKASVELCEKYLAKDHSNKVEPQSAQTGATAAPAAAAAGGAPARAPEGTIKLNGGTN